MANTTTKSYQDGDPLLEDDLDNLYENLQPSLANLALATAGSSSGDLLSSAGAGITPAWSSPDTIAANMTSTGADAIAADMTSTGANAIAATMTSTGANAIFADISSGTASVSVSDSIVSSIDASVATSLVSRITTVSASVANLIGAVMTALGSSTSGVAIKGTTTNDNAAAGNVGEAVRGYASGVSVATNNTWQNCTSISLTAGDWDVSGLMVFGNNGATATEVFSAISINSGTTTTDHVQGDNVANGINPTAAYNSSLAIPDYRLSLSSTTTVYLKGRATFSAGNPEMYGRISARRVR